MEELRKCCALSLAQPVNKIVSKKYVDTFFIRIVMFNLFINRSNCKTLRKEIKTVNGDDIKRSTTDLNMMVPGVSRLVVLRGQYHPIDHGVLPILLFLKTDDMINSTLFNVKLFAHFDMDRVFAQLNSPCKTD